MNNLSEWWEKFSVAEDLAILDGIIPVQGYNKAALSIEQVAIMEKARHYKADAVFFEVSYDGKPPVAQAFIYRSDGLSDNQDFAELHRRLWSWGGVPLVYRVTSGLVQLFRCAHRPDFEQGAKIKIKPYKTLHLATQIAKDPWWDIERLRNGTLWDDPSVCNKLLSSREAAQKTLIKAVQDLYEELNKSDILPQALSRKLLILSILIAYLEKRGVFEVDFFSKFLPGADKFFQVLANGSALLKLLDHLETRFNGHVFVLNNEEREVLSNDNEELVRYAELIEARRAPSGQITLWERYSFADLPVQLISHIYQLFVEDTTTAIYTPHFVVRLMLDEVLDWERLNRLEENDEVILDPACGSGIFLVEAYKRLVLHWRAQNDWQHPDQETLKDLLTKRLRGVDLEDNAVDLTAFSLCLALCDALEPEEIRTSVKLFPPLKEKSIHKGCFFEVRENQLAQEQVGVIIGNPPFTSNLNTDGAVRAYEEYQRDHGLLPDKQLAYLFLHKSMETLVNGGALAMLQQYNFLYNQKSIDFRRDFIRRWDVREILDFISIRGLFQKSGADTKVIVIVAEADTPPPERQILHATFRRSGRANAEQGFDIDYYDMHWLPRELCLKHDAIWRCNLLGGGRVLDFVERLADLRTLEEYARENGWDYGEGYIADARNNKPLASHITGKPLLPPSAIGLNGIDPSKIITAPKRSIESPRSESRFTPPMILIREHMDLAHDLWTRHYLTYKNKIVGFCGPAADNEKLRTIDSWLRSQLKPLKAYAAAISIRLFTQKATTLSAKDIYNLPYPITQSLNLSSHERILVDDIVDYYRALVRLGNKSTAIKKPGVQGLPAFNEIFTSRINSIYQENQLIALDEYTWPGVICQPYVFGSGEVDWTGANELKGKLDRLLREKRGSGLNVTRIARIYDGACIYLLKPDRLRYWLRSIALRDADETLADLAEQGF